MMKDEYDHDDDDEGETSTDWKSEHHAEETKIFSILLRRPRALAQAQSPPGSGPGPAEKDGKFK